MSNKKVGNFEAKKQKQIKELLVERNASFLKEVKDSAFIFDKTIQKSINKILAKIYIANPQIDHNDFVFFISKSMIPNAACYGNGVFSINLGLFALIENDDELAFIICHEIAHHLLKHGDKSIDRYLATFNSKETKNQIDKAANQTYGRRAAVSALMKNLDYNFMKQSRGAEVQADSLGFILFNKTNYNKQASVNALKKLDFSDNMIFNATTNLKQNFDFNEYPFKEVWISAEEKLFNLKESADDLKFDTDSLKTHPDIPFRIQTLNTNFKFASTNSTVSELDKLQKSAFDNSIKIYFDDLQLDFALYQLLALHEKKEISDDEFCNSVAYLLKKVYLLKEKHVFGKYVKGVSPFSEEKNINEIRLFLNNIELKNIRKIGYYFCLKNESKIKDNVVFQDSFNFFKNLNQN